MLLIPLGIGAVIFPLETEYSFHNGAATVGVTCVNPCDIAGPTLLSQSQCLFENNPFISAPHFKIADSLD